MAMGAVDSRLDAVMASLNKSLMLLSSYAQRLGATEQEERVATTASFATTTTLRFVQYREQEKLETKLLSSYVISTHQAMAVDALNADVVLAPATPTRCSTFVLASPQEVLLLVLMFSSQTSHAATPFLALLARIQASGERRALSSS
jgi:hypothetical protein